MAAGGREVLPPDVVRDLVGELAQATLRGVAPEELVLFEESAADYFRDPNFLAAAKHRDEAVGFGLDMALLTPYVLAVGAGVVQFLASTIADTVHDALVDELKPAVGDTIRRLFRQDGPSVPHDKAAGDTAANEKTAMAAQGLTPDQGRAVRRVAFDRARQIGLDEAKASLLADAFVGALLVDIDAT